MYYSLCTVESPCIHWYAVLGKVLAWPFFGAPSFGAQQYCSPAQPPAYWLTQCMLHTCMIYSDPVRVLLFCSFRVYSQYSGVLLFFICFFSGTPPRILASSIQTGGLDKQIGDEPPQPFSLLNERPVLNVCLNSKFLTLAHAMASKRCRL